MHKHVYGGKKRTGKNIHKILTVSDSRFLPLVTKVNPWVSMATPVLWTCSSTYLSKHTKRSCCYWWENQSFFSLFWWMATITALALLYLQITFRNGKSISNYWPKTQLWKKHTHTQMTGFLVHKTESPHLENITTLITQFKYLNTNGIQHHNFNNLVQVLEHQRNTTALKNGKEHPPPPPRPPYNVNVTFTKPMVG